MSEFPDEWNGWLFFALICDFEYVCHDSVSALDGYQSPLGLDTQRDGKQLLDLLLEPANAQTEAVQVAYNAQIAKVHSLAYDLSTPLPFSSEQPPQAEIVSFLEAYWSAIRHTDPNGVRADPKTFVKTSLLVLKRIPELASNSQLSHMWHAIENLRSRSIPY